MVDKLAIKYWENNILKEKNDDGFRKKHVRLP